MSNTVKITINGAKLSAVTPYNTLFIAAAHRLDGRFLDGAWVFDARDEARVRAMCSKYYGNDGLTADVCTLRVKYDSSDSASRGPLTINGRVIAKATGRDSGAKPGEGIILLEGSFRSGGSVNNWVTCARDGTVVLVRDFPRKMADKLVAETPDEFAIEDEKPPVDREALEAERARLAERLDEIDALLGGVRLDSAA